MAKFPANLISSPFNLPHKVLTLSIRYFSKAKTRDQSFFMLITTQPFLIARS
jgi:hypothetical protein